MPFPTSNRVGGHNSRHRADFGNGLLDRHHGIVLVRFSSRQCSRRSVLWADRTVWYGTNVRAVWHIPTPSGSAENPPCKPNWCSRFPHGIGDSVTPPVCERNFVTRDFWRFAHDTSNKTGDPAWASFRYWSSRSARSVSGHGNRSKPAHPFTGSVASVRHFSVAPVRADHEGRVPCANAGGRTCGGMAPS